MAMGFLGAARWLVGGSHHSTAQQRQQTVKAATRREERAEFQSQPKRDEK
jgi:hypothetical protein